MKEFLNPDQGYKLVCCEVGETPIPDNWIEVQDGANFKTELYFWKSMDSSEHNWGTGWFGNGDNSIKLKDYLSEKGVDIVWQREKVEVEVDNVSEKLSKVDETLKERKSQYGCFEDVAFVTQGFIEIMSKCKYKEMPQPHQMALYMIASKMARLVNGDCNHKDSWHDIGGYAKLIEDLIGDNS